MQRHIPNLGALAALVCCVSGAHAAPPVVAAEPAAMSEADAAEAEEAPSDDPAVRAAERQAAHDKAGQQLPDPAQAPPIRRGGLAFGLGAAAALGGASGYPNDGTKINDPAYYTNTGVGFGAAASLWLGYAIADWVTFGLAVNGGVVDTGDATVRSGGAGLRVELFPAWLLGGPWQEIGLLIEPGLGFIMVEASEGGLDPLIESGGGSHLALGLFYEGVRLWQFSMGPYLGADLIWSSSSLSPVGLLGWRAAYYGGP